MDKNLALAEYLGIDESEVEETDENTFDTPEGEYVVLTDEEADKWAHDEAEMLFDDMGLEAFSENFQKWILDNAIDEDEVNDFIDSEIDYFENIEPDEDMLNYLNSLDSKNEKLNYIKELYGDFEGFSDWSKDKIDMEAVVEEMINLDGRGSLIADWDGEEEELPDGLYAYRMN